MRLRSSQLVFLMLLICSPQVRQQYAAQRMTGAIAEGACVGAHHRSAESADAGRSAARIVASTSAPNPAQLDPAADAAHHTPWPMPHPAAASSATVSHTSFLRA